MSGSQDHISPTDHCLPSTATGDQAMPGHESQHASPRPYPTGTFIHILDDDSLLEIFQFCRPVILENVTGTIRIFRRIWTHERWWYKVAQVCQRWRHLVLASALHLRLSLVCTRGTPVAEMLAHSPPFPLVIDDVDDNDFIATEDEEGIILALKHRDRVRHIHLNLPPPNLQKIIMALEDEFPILECLLIEPPTKQNLSLKLPKSLRAPHLRHLLLRNFAFPMGSPLLTTSICSLSLLWVHPSVYFHPNDLLQRLSQMPHIETLGITFHSPVPNRDVEWELLRRPRMTHVTLPNLSWFAFGGASAYLEALLPCITAPRLAKLEVIFFNQLSFRLPHLLDFLNTEENLRFTSATLIFKQNNVVMFVHSRPEARIYDLAINISCRKFDWQVASTAQIFSVLWMASTAVENLTLRYERYSLESNNEADCTQWRDLLRSFSNVKTLCVEYSKLVDGISRSLQLEDGESPMELLPELRELSCPSFPNTGAFTQFIDARRLAGHPILLLEPPVPFTPFDPPRPDYSPFSEPLVIRSIRSRSLSPFVPPCPPPPRSRNPSKLAK
ncbi:hypothetical protein BC827DRAFT_85252 [Russula dissimulans]|nr:hypothetical protein BC827DRAFT_85252 [Russula dissimulans]